MVSAPHQDEPRVHHLTHIYLLAWFANCIAPAKLGDVYRGYLLNRRNGASFARTFGTILSERCIDVIVLMTLLVISGLFTFHGSVPPALHWTFLGGAVLLACAVGGLVLLLFFGQHAQRRLPLRIQPHYARVKEGILTSFTLRSIPPILGFSLTIWLLEGVRVLAIVYAVGLKLTIAESLFVALLASLLTTFPITPAGLGAVEGGTIVALKLLGFSATTAGVVTLIDRGIAYWSIVLVGGILWLVSARRPRRAAMPEPSMVLPEPEPTG
jgi:uncharacterized membrane protein YbhN (UPF0104 family)